MCSYKKFKYATIILCSTIGSLHAKLIEIKSIQDFKTLRNSGQPLIIKFSSKTCPPCRFTKVPFDEVAEESEFATISFAEFSTDTPTGDAIANEYKVLGVPTFIYIVNGKVMKTVSGVDMTKETKATFKAGVQNLARELMKAQVPAAPQELKKEVGMLEDIEKPEEISGIEVDQEEEAVSMQPAPAESRGIVAQLWGSIIGFFSFIWDALKGAVKFVIDTIKGIFGIK